MTALGEAQLHQLHQLARLYGVQIGYYDVVARHPRRALPETLLAVLRALEAPLESLQDVPAALRARQQALWQRCAPPVAVAWDGGPGVLELRLPTSLAKSSVACSLALESGEVRRWKSALADLPTEEAAEVEGVRYAAKTLPLPAGLPWGYHRVTLEIQGRRFETLLVAAPLRAYTLPEGAGEKDWGVFVPLYALHSRRSPGSGDFSDLQALLGWASSLGSSLVGSLPLLAAFLDEPCEPSPYQPASCLFWNEFYLDLTRIPELKRSPAAQALLASPGFQAELKAVHSSPLVSYRRAMALKRQILEELARGFFAEPGGRHSAFQSFLQAHPSAEDYARFRAAGERRRTSWPAWPQPLRDGQLRESDYDEEARRYHLYVQWLAHEQLQTLAQAARQKGPGLYLDLPLGVHPESYDIWRERDIFALGASGGAPPDSFFIRGQNWGFPPLHPEKLRAQGYRYTIACLRHLLENAGIVRIDHVMGLHRQFWIPRGLEVKDGVYVRKRAEELYAILTLESHRHRTVMVGEDLGTVPRYVRLAMARHKILRSYVLQFEITLDPGRALRPVPPDCVATLNTHDIRPFAGFWQGLDIQDRVELGLLEESDARRERQHRQSLRQALVRFLQRGGWLRDASPELAVILKACLAYLGASPARLVLVNLEDLWLEVEQQNTPGTRFERPNWRRKACYVLEMFCQLPPILDTLRELDQQRKRGTTA